MRLEARLFCMLVRPCARAVAVFVAVMLVACTRPLTLEECQQRSDALDCMDNTVLIHTAQNAVVGGIIGAAVGGGIGYAVGGPVGAARGAVAGAVGGGTVGGLVTYYVEHREANALADLDARNRKLAQYLQVYQTENDKLQDRARVVQAQLSQASSDDAQLEQLKKEIQADHVTNQAFLQRVTVAVSSIEAERQQFKAAIDYARQHGMLMDVGPGLVTHENSENGFIKIEQDTNIRIRNNFENGRYD
jgi:uncharacterized protein YcfJ